MTHAYLKKTIACLVAIVMRVCLERTCMDEVDDAGIHWPVMLAGHIAVQRCPPSMTGRSAILRVTRRLFYLVHARGTV